MEEYVSLAVNYGFSVGVAWYLLTRFEKKIERLSDAIEGKDGLISEIRELRKSIEDKK